MNISVYTEIALVSPLMVESILGYVNLNVQDRQCDMAEIHYDDCLHLNGSGNIHSIVIEGMISMRTF